MLDDPRKSPEALPPLENGKRLTRAEFERRCDAVPSLKKAELIEGEAHMPSPVSAHRHGLPPGHVGGWLSRRPGAQLTVDSSVRRDAENESQPDALLMIEPGHAGHARISDDVFVEGAPELIVEIASSSVTHDVGRKLKVDCRDGVREYVVWRVRDQTIDWHARSRFAWRHSRLPVS
jgi:Uma2 family endonuclease